MKLRSTNIGFPFFLQKKRTFKSESCTVSLVCSEKLFSPHPFIQSSYESYFYKNASSSFFPEFPLHAKNW